MAHYSMTSRGVWGRAKLRDYVQIVNLREHFLQGVCPVGLLAATLPGQLGWVLDRRNMGKSQRLPERKRIFRPRGPSAEAAKATHAKAIGPDKRKLIFLFLPSAHSPLRRRGILG